MRYLIFALTLFFASSLTAAPAVKPGIDRLIQDQLGLLRGKRIGLITNQTGVNSQMESTTKLLKRHAASGSFALVALFSPEHGIDGSIYADDPVSHSSDSEGIPIYSLAGATKKPTPNMLHGIDLLIYDIQDIGSRSYTYSTTLFLAMEAAAKEGIPVVVLDRPNPINGIVVDGPVLEEKWRTCLGYLNIPYCHGMTIGELAHYFNAEYRVGCKLTVIPMEGWRRTMTFADTGLHWIPTSPHIPEATTALYYPATGILGTLKLVNTGVWYSLPFRLIGAPWIDAKVFADTLNAQRYPGVLFRPFHYRPYYGRYAQEECHGVYIVVTDHLKYQPVSTQYLILGVLKTLYPKPFQRAVETAHNHRQGLCNLLGTEEFYRILTQQRYIVWPLRALHAKERELFLKRRERYLLYKN